MTAAEMLNKFSEAAQRERLTKLQAVAEAAAKWLKTLRVNELYGESAKRAEEALESLEAALRAAGYELEEK